MRVATLLLILCASLLGCDKRGDGGDETSAAAAPTSPEPATAPDVVETAVAADPDPATEAPAPEAAPRPAAEPMDEEARIAKAMALIDAMRSAYVAAPTIVQRVNVHSTMAGSEIAPEETLIALGHGQDMRVVSTNNVVVALDGNLNVKVNSIAERYIRVPIQTDPLGTMRGVFGRYRGAMIAPALRYGRPKDEIIFNLAFGLPQRPRVSGFRVIEDQEGRTLHQISLISASGSTSVNVDPETHLVVSAEVNYQVPNSPVPNFRVRRQIDFDTQVRDALPEPITFDPQGRTPVRTIAALRGQAEPEISLELAVEVGDRMSAFKLHTLEGSEVNSEQLAGSVVLLVFWSDWNVASRSGLRNVDTLARWCERAENGVQIHPVHVLGKGDSAGEIWERVHEFWDGGEFSIASLFDPQNTLADAFGVTAVPVTVLVDRDGVIQDIGSGLDPDQMNALRVQIERAAGR